MAFARLYISKFSRGRMPPDSPDETRLGREFGKLTSAPPKFCGPYAYVFLYLKNLDDIAAPMSNASRSSTNVGKL